MRQIDAPAGPPGWEGMGAQLIRIVDPRGSGVAWLAPEFGGNCVGYAAHLPGGGWAQILHSRGPRALRERPTRYGCPILCPFPGHLPGARYRWGGATHQLPPNAPNGADYLHGFAHRHRWRFIERDPTAATLELATATDLDEEERAGYPFDLRLCLTASLEDGGLLLDLTATNEGDGVAPAGLGFHPYFAVDALGGERERIRVTLPGRVERALTPIPTGERREVRSPDVMAPPLGERELLSRTDLEARAVATLVSADGGERVTLTAVAGVRDLVLFAPSDEPSLSLEPLGCAPSAAALPPEGPDGLPGLPPGATARLAVRIAAGAQAGAG